MRRGFLVVLVLTVLSTVAFAGVISVAGTDDIMYAGYGTPGNSAGSGNSGQGNFPNFIALGAGATSVTFSSITGSASFCVGAGCSTGADGMANPYGGGGTSLASINSLSGVSYAGQVFFLLGVFTNGSTPSGAAPATITNTNASVLGGSFNPLLNQIFFIGDGQGTGGTQTFFVPSGAANLYLGFADGTPAFTGSVGAFNDNSGSLSATYTVNAAAVPEPATFGLIGLGLAGLGLVRKRIWR